MALILASASASRRAILDAAGISFTTQPTTIDESRFKTEARDPRLVANELAEAKALDVSKERPGAWVIGSDSIVSVEDASFDKPVTRADAADHLRAFSNRTMELTSAVALARNGLVDWVHSETALLKVRELSEAFIQHYLDQEWPAVGQCVGVFRIEGRGAHLFDRLEGSHFTILGMPLLPLLAALRDRGLAPQ